MSLNQNSDSKDYSCYDMWLPIDCGLMQGFIALITVQKSHNSLFVSLLF